MCYTKYTQYNAKMYYILSEKKTELTNNFVSYMSHNI